MQCRTCQGRGEYLTHFEGNVPERRVCDTCSGTGSEADPFVPDPMERIAAALEKIAESLDAIQRNGVVVERVP